MRHPVRYLGPTAVAALLAFATPAHAYNQIQVGACLGQSNGVISRLSAVGNNGAVVTGVSYTIQASDGCKDVLINSATTNMPVTLPRSTNSGFGYGWGTNVINQSATQAVVVTVVTSTLPNGVTSLTIPAQTQCVFNVDQTGNNYYLGECSATVNSATAISSLTGPVTAAGPGAAASSITNNAVTNAMLAQGPGGQCVKAVAANATGNYADLCNASGTASVLSTNSGGTAIGWNGINLGFSYVGGVLPYARGGLNNASLINGAPSSTTSLPGTSPSFISTNSSLSFVVKIGTGGTASTGSLSMAATAPLGWGCLISDLTTPNVEYRTVETGYTTTTVSFGNYSVASNTATAWAAGDYLFFSCTEF